MSQQGQERVTPEAYNMIMLSRIERHLGNIERRLSAVETQAIPFDRTKLWRHLEIAAGGSGIVYYYGFEGYTAQIYYVGVKWFPLCHIEWEVDNSLREDIRRTIGNADHPMGEPLRIDPPLMARRNIRFTAYNGGTVSRIFEVFCDGILYRNVGAGT